MVDINYDEQITHQENRLKELVALEIKIRGAIEMLQLLKAEAERKVETVVEEVKQEACTLAEKVEAVEAEITGK